MTKFAKDGICNDDFTYQAYDNVDCIELLIDLLEKYGIQEDFDQLSLIFEETFQRNKKLYENLFLESIDDHGEEEEYGKILGLIFEGKDEVLRVLKQMK